MNGFFNSEKLKKIENKDEKMEKLRKKIIRKQFGEKSDTVNQ